LGLLAEELVPEEQEVLAEKTNNDETAPTVEAVDQAAKKTSSSIRIELRSEAEKEKNFDKTKDVSDDLIENNEDGLENEFTTVEETINKKKQTEVEEKMNKKKRKRRSSAKKNSDNDNDDSTINTSPMNKSMPQRPKTILSDKYSKNVVAENVDCTHVQTENEYIDFFKRKCTEFLGSNWTINGNARFISVENKIIHYFACVKNKTKAISCQLKCIVELDLNTKIARFMKNSEQHNHDENTCVHRLGINCYVSRFFYQIM
jgi:hypothetical protein